VKFDVDLGPAIKSVVACGRRNNFDSSRMARHLLLTVVAFASRLRAPVGAWVTTGREGCHRMQGMRGCPALQALAGTTRGPAPPRVRALA